MEKKPNIGKSFLDYRFNTLLKDRLRDSFIMAKKAEECSKNISKLRFSNEVESGNLELAAKVNDN